MASRIQTMTRLPAQLRTLVDRAVPALRLRNRQEFVEQALERELLHALPVILDEGLRSDILQYVTRTGMDNKNGGAKHRN